jgi:TonB family protein
MEFTLLLTWFNPFSWLISRMIKENHEHLADRQVLSVGISPARYKAQLLNHTLGENVFRLGNQFNHSLTLKRFKMMKKPKRNPAGIVKIALMIPAVLVTMGLTTGMTKQQKTIKGKITLADTGEPAVGAAIVVRNGTLGTTSDARGAFMLKVEENPELVVSFVGYSSLVVKSSEIGKEPLELVPTSYDIDISQLPDQDPGDKHEVDVLSPKEMSSLALSDKDVLEVDEQTFYIVEEMPSFPEGNAALKKYVYSKLQYPESAKEKGLSGEVFVQFIVTPSGKLEDIEVAKSSDKVFEEAALAVFRDMPDWLPGSQRGKAVRVKVVISIPFNIEKV